jgi:hypothetical protein
MYPQGEQRESNAGGGLHSSDSGYCKMGDVIDLGWFD